MIGDGNCCFSAVAFSIISNSENLTNSQKATFKSNGIDVLVDLNSLADIL